MRCRCSVLAEKSSNYGGKFGENVTVAHNVIKNTVESSTQNGEVVCVHGSKDGKGFDGVPSDFDYAKWGCRNLGWGVYLDGGMSGVRFYGNVIESGLRG